jgi:sugar lactone lactonase YvrE
MFLTRIVLCLVTALVVVASAAAKPFPEVIALPTGFQPEGIAVGKGHTFFVGSLATGDVYRGDLRTGAAVPPLIDAPTGRIAVGMKVDQRGRLFVAGGPTGQAYVYDSRTGASLALFQLAPAGTAFINDVVVTRTAAWFTDSFNAVLYRVAIAPDGTLGAVTTVTLTGGQFVLVPGQFNTNGIDATPNGKALIIVQSITGKLFKVDPQTGFADLIELTGGDAASGDGILLDGKTLYVVQNFLNRIAVIRLSPQLGSGKVMGHLTDPDFKIPTTIAEHGRRLFAVNARFDLPPAQAPTAAYSVVQVRKDRSP